MPVGTQREITADLERLGLVPGDTVLVHASLRSLGPVDGGGAAVVRALRAAIGPSGTLVAPTFTAANSLTSRVHRRRVRGMTPADAAAYLAAMRPFDPRTSPAADTGRIAELLRTAPGALRSTHPTTSFTAIGPRAARIVADHADDCLLGERSPLARLYEAGARVLLLGVGFRTCTAFHLAEYRVRNPPRRRYTCLAGATGTPLWRDFEDVDLDDGDFHRIGRHLEAGPRHALVARGPVGAATARLLPLRAAVDAAVRWMAEYRGLAAPDGG